MNINIVKKFSDRLLDKVAIITGAGGGIGAETATVLASQGAHVVCTDINLNAVKALAERINSSGGKALAFCVDVSAEDQVEEMVAATIKEYGRIDILHNNAAMLAMDHMMADNDILTIDVEHWDRTMAVNLRGAMLCCKHSIPHMITSGGGSIINMGSGKGIQGDVAQTAYGTSKAALIGFTRYAATQYGKQGIRANILVVGVVLKGDDLKGEGLSPQRAAQLERYAAHHLTAHLGAPRHIADAVAFLASDESAFITGTQIPIDGGFTSHSPTLAEGRQIISN